MIRRWERHVMDGMLELHNKSPIWNEGTVCLNTLSYPWLLIDKYDVWWCVVTVSCVTVRHSVVCAQLSRTRHPGLGEELPDRSRQRSRLHCDAVWPHLGGRVHNGLQLPAVCRAGLRCRADQFRRQTGVWIAALRRVLLPPVVSLELIQWLTSTYLLCYYWQLLTCCWYSHHLCELFVSEWLQYCLIRLVVRCWWHCSQCWRWIVGFVWIHFLIDWSLITAMHACGSLHQLVSTSNSTCRETFATFITFMFQTTPARLTYLLVYVADVTAGKHRLRHTNFNFDTISCVYVGEQFCFYLFTQRLCRA